MRTLTGTIITLVLIGVAAATSLAGTAQKAPDFSGGGPWLNTGGNALSLGELRGKVVAVEMWTAGCYNCLNVVPSLREWDAKYRAKGLVIIGVHTPEFSNERSTQYVRDAVAKLGIAYPVVLDNDYRIWNAYRNVYWPTLYLVDKKGLVRYTHIGEGAYEQTERMIRQLLDEPT